jgi:hypothetical protein
MADIHYNLNNASTLACMVPPTIGPGAFGNAAIPGGMAGNAGMYIIWNSTNNNRYAGIATDLGTRFGGRMETVTEMGFDIPQMRTMFAFWGQVHLRNSAPGSAWTIVPGYAAPLYGIVDGYNIHLERLLIRFLVTQFAGGPGATVSNNLLAYAQYANGSPNAVNVRLTWGGVGGPGGVAGGTQVYTWNPGMMNAW